ncbi:hypothetical protein [Wenyingzhuangia aestuarii]|uniref:hypothetical protein n=1 Tax=Wenyingzhuangia aestuarii TaxID=1647582 RepID=UPI0014395C6A|nr:hypothetical protein [Wenyingzhuangia aestuarii]NJB83967.1 hypothetical protein [Wenyingzhuangia aestuarii]
MKKILYSLIVLLIISCSSSKATAYQTKDDTPPKYQKILLVTDAYYTNKNIVKKLFNTELKNNLTISKINTKIVELVKEEFNYQNKKANSYLIKNNLDHPTILTTEEIQQNIDEQILSNNIDLMVTIFQKDIKRVYNKLNTKQTVFKDDSYSATTNSSNLKYTYIFTGIDVSNNTVVFKSEHHVQNADDLVNNIPKHVAKDLVKKLNEKHLY